MPVVVDEIDQNGARTFEVVDVSLRHRTCHHEAGHAVVALCLDMVVTGIALFSDTDGPYIMTAREPSTRRLQEQAHRSHDAVAVAGNMSVRRRVGDVAAEHDLADADKSIADDQQRAEELADIIVTRYYSGTADAVEQSFRDEVTELVDHERVRDAIERVAAALLASETMSLNADAVQKAFNPPASSPGPMRAHDRRNPHLSTRKTDTLQEVSSA